MSSYLSIDLDYWMEKYPNEMLGYLNELVGTGIPISFFVFHEEILKDINNIDGLDTLFNVDFHSDMGDNFKTGESLELNEGTWANYVDFRRNGHFIWIYPQKECYSKPIGSRGHGRCDVYRNPFGKKCIEVCDWEKTSHRCGKLPTPKEFADIFKIGICISPNWIGELHRKEALRFFSQCGLMSKYFVNKIEKASKDCYHWAE